MSHRKRQPTSLAPQDRKSRKLRLPEVWKICGDRQTRSFGLYAWGEYRARWARKEKDGKGFYTVGLVETFFSKIDLR